MYAQRLMAHTPDDVARWMLAQVETGGELDHWSATDEIEQLFGGEFVYPNDHCNPAVDPRVLRAFRKLSGDRIVWVRYTRSWRLREPDDEPGRQQRV